MDAWLIAEYDALSLCAGQVLCARPPMSAPAFTLVDEDLTARRSRSVNGARSPCGTHSRRGTSARGAGDNVAVLIGKWAELLSCRPPLPQVPRSAGTPFTFTPGEKHAAGNGCNYFERLGPNGWTTPTRSKPVCH